MNGFVVINPSSGTQTVQKTALQILHTLLLDEDIQGIQVRYTHKKDDARVMCAALKPGEYDFVLAVGGDGTVNEVVAGLYESKSNIPLMILPAGTTNDFAVALGLPRTVEGVCDTIRARHSMAMDIGRFNNSYFFNVAAGGLLSEVAHAVPSEMKTAFGRMAYLTEGGKKILENKFETTPLIFEIDGVEEQHDVYFFLVTNSTSVGGFNKISPDSKINDGFLELLIVKKLDFFTALPAMMQIQSGLHINNEKLFEYRRVRQVQIRPAKEGIAYPLDYDGEFGGNLPLNIEIIPQAVNLLIPKNSAKTDKLISNSDGIKGNEVAGN
ncbi:MAG: diacylglycerol kinase family lipid kinase [Clostridia bacterium]|nr:diacylglycerol kinase family lipid kinase [Clostridia bacterium]